MNFINIIFNQLIFTFLLSFKTGTFKMPKIKLQKEGYDFYNIKDPLYFLDMQKKKYVRIDEQVYQDIINGNIKI